MLLKSCGFTDLIIKHDLQTHFVLVTRPPWTTTRVISQDLNCSLSTRTYGATHIENKTLLFIKKAIVAFSALDLQQHIFYRS